MQALANGFSGGCFCGAVTYRVAGAPRFAYLCHCTDCRRINGTAFHTGLGIDRAVFSFEGAPASFAITADSGNTVTRWFCATCAGQLWSATTADDTLISVKAGTVTSAPEDAIRPTLQIFADSRVPWGDVAADLTTYARGMRGATPIAP